MKDKLDRAYQQTLEQITRLNLELIELTKFKARLEQAGAEAPPLPQMAPRALEQGIAPKKRAPKGSVEASLLGVMTKKGQTNAELRNALKVKGYRYSLETVPIAKVLNRMAEGKRIKKSSKDDRVEFSLP